MTKKRGERGPATLFAVTYPVLKRLTGLSVRTLQDYRSKGQLDASSLDSIVEFVNRHRAKRGRKPLGGDGDRNAREQDDPMLERLAAIQGERGCSLREAMAVLEQEKAHAADGPSQIG